MRWQAVVPFFFVSSLVVAAPTISSLRYKQLSREAASRKFMAEASLGHAKMGLWRMTQNKNRVEELANGIGAASQSELSTAIVQVLDKQFEVKRQDYLKAEAAMLETSWDMQSKWAAGTETENPKKLAKLYLDLRQARVAILLELEKDAAPFAATLKKERARIERLPAGATSKGEVELVVSLSKEADELQTMASNELITARKHLEESQKDFDSFPEVPPVPTQIPLSKE